MGGDQYEGKIIAYCASQSTAHVTTDPRGGEGDEIQDGMACGEKYLKMDRSEENESETGTNGHKALFEAVKWGILSCKCAWQT